MQTYEFNAVVRDGLIHIPKHLSEENLSYVKIIMLTDSVNQNPEPRKNRFTAMRLKTKGLTYNREELYERQGFS
jgi:hypothetical protein